jgi:hypothetical protein
MTDQKVDWARKAELLAAENTRLRNGILAIKDRIEDAPHVRMRNGITMHQYCRELVIGATPELESHKDAV